MAAYVLAVINIYQRINYLGSDYLGTHMWSCTISR